MNSTEFYLNDEKTDFVALKWDDGWKNTIVYRNKDKIGELSTKRDLKFGRPFQASDGKVIYIQLKGSIFGKPYLDVLIDGYHYDYREPTTEDKIHKIFKIILAIAGTNILLGLSGALLNIVSIDKLGFGYYSVVYGFIFLGLGLAFRYKKSLLSVIVMSLIMIFELVYYIKAISQIDIDELLESNFNGIIARIVLIIVFIRGGIYIIQYKRENNITQAKELQNT